METYGIGNAKHIIIKRVLYPIMTATASKIKMSLPSQCERALQERGKMFSVVEVSYIFYRVNSLYGKDSHIIFINLPNFSSFLSHLPLLQMRMSMKVI